MIARNKLNKQVYFSELEASHIIASLSFCIKYIIRNHKTNRELSKTLKKLEKNWIFKQSLGEKTE
jgi:hypothetical protein